jgi:prephenate dehydrogenase
MKVGILGIGLIGGSLALSARKHISDVEIFGLDQNVDNLDRSITIKLIDFKLNSADLKLMDLLLIAMPVDEASKQIVSLLDEVHNNGLVIDFGSTKASICDRVALHSKRGQFLATHPIAGTEFSGPDAAMDDLFLNKTQILCETYNTRPDLLEWAENWFRKMGMQIRPMDPVEHDQHIAYVSHLSHISSFMLGKTVVEKEKNEKTIFEMAGSGFESTVRLAKSSPDMWIPIFNQNKDNILETLSEYINNLNQFKNLLEANEYDKLYQQIVAINSISEILEGINKTSKH